MILQRLSCNINSKLTGRWEDLGRSQTNECPSFGKIIRNDLEIQKMWIWISVYLCWEVLVTCHAVYNRCATT